MSERIISVREPMHSADGGKHHVEAFTGRYPRTVASLRVEHKSGPWWPQAPQHAAADRRVA